jgi:glycosyltransferase involved in cell wall biosynthesis
MQKKKILLLSDHPLSTSGVGTQARFLIDGLLKTGKYSFRCLGAAVKHADYRTIVVNDDFVIKPIDGFGTPQMLRVILATERPDAVMLFTDPRFFYHIFSMEDEIHQICPIVYNHLWDALPSPEFNKQFYESTDLINCINWTTYQFCKEWFPDRTNYIPHALPSDLYYPLPDATRHQHRIRFFGSERANHFLGLFVGRNARRKSVGDIIESWKFFLDRLEKEEGHRRASLVLHTDPLDQEGSNLFAVADKLGLKDNVIFSKERVEFRDMNALYNAVDVNLNKSFAEGFGLPVLEGKMTGLPAVVVKTGGLTRQIEDHITGEQYGVALEPEVRTIVGNQMIPYIYEEHVSNKTYSDAIHQIYKMSPEQRQELSTKTRAHALRDYNIEDVIKTWDVTLQKTLNSWQSKYQPWTCQEF